MKDDLTALVVGYGSIGKRHALIAAERVGTLGVVDSSSAATAQASKDLARAITASSIGNLDRSWPWDRTIAIIATWGPSHPAIFEELVQRGVRRVICEKPLAASVRAGAAMVDSARENRVALGVNMQRRYSGLAVGVHELSRRFDLGRPVQVLVHGGARCLVTNGIHYIDFASELFGASPVSVTSDATADDINPRSPDLRYYEGAASWRFADGRRAAIVFSNASSLAGSMLVYFRDAVMELADSNVVRVTRRATTDARIVRTAPASETIFDGEAPGSTWGNAPMVRLFDEVASGSVLTLPPAIALQALGDCIGALTAGETRVTVSLPIDPDSPAGRREWPIS